jgi:hypothetical protein
LGVTYVANLNLLGTLNFRVDHSLKKCNDLIERYRDLRGDQEEEQEEEAEQEDDVEMGEPEEIEDEKENVDGDVEMVEEMNVGHVDDGNVEKEIQEATESSQDSVDEVVLEIQAKLAKKHLMSPKKPMTPKKRRKQEVHQEEPRARRHKPIQKTSPLKETPKIIAAEERAHVEEEEEEQADMTVKAQSMERMIDKIVGHEGKTRNSLKLKVRWVGKAASFNSLERASDLELMHPSNKVKINKYLQKHHLG